VESEDPGHFAYRYDRHVIRPDHGFGFGFGCTMAIAKASGACISLVTDNWTNGPLANWQLVTGSAVLALVLAIRKLMQLGQRHQSCNGLNRLHASIMTTN